MKIKKQVFIFRECIVWCGRVRYLKLSFYYHETHARNMYVPRVGLELRK